MSQETWKLLCETLNPPQLSVVCAYNGIHALDFDDGPLFYSFLDATERILSVDVKSITHVHSTPSGGYHVLFLSRTDLPTTVLACDENGHPTIELKGSGAAIVVAGEGYREELSTLSIDGLSFLDENTIDVFLTVARSFDRRPLPQPALHVSVPPVTIHTEQILLRNGWECLSRTATGKSYWCRPGARHKHSHATLGLGNNGELFYVFSSLAHPFEPGCYTPLQVYALLEHDGNIQKALAALRGERQKVVAGAPLSPFDITLPFPLHVLPSPVMEYVAELSRFTQTPPDIGGMFFLSLYSAVRGCRINAQFHFDYQEPCALYVLIAADSGMRKSATFRHVLRSLVTEPYLLDDTTPEALVRSMAQHNGECAVLSPESGVFATISGRYGDSNIDVLLKAYTREPVRVSRKHYDEDLFLPLPFLAIGVSIQPDMMRKLVAYPALEERGLLSRFLYSVPPSNIGKRNVCMDAMNAPIKTEYDAFLLRTQQKRQEAPVCLPLDDAARHLFVALCQDIESRLSPGRDLYPLQKWGCKLHGNLLRLAALIADMQDKTVVDTECIDRAETFAEYAITHAHAAHVLMHGSDTSLTAYRVLSVLRARNSVDMTWLLNHCYTFVSSRTEMENIIGYLLERGYVRVDGETVHAQ